MLLDSYKGPFDDKRTLADFSRQALCFIGREYLLLGHNHLCWIRLRDTGCDNCRLALPMQRGKIT